MMKASLFIKGNDLKKEISQLAWKENLTDEEKIKLARLAQEFNDIILRAKNNILENYDSQLEENDKLIEESMSSLKWSYNGYKYHLSSWEKFEVYD